MRAEDRIGFNIGILGVALRDPRGCLTQKVLAAFGIAYLLLPNDLIPDRLPFGYLDDATILSICGFLAWAMIPDAYIARLSRNEPRLVVSPGLVSRGFMPMALQLRGLVQHGRWRTRFLLVLLLGLLLRGLLLRLMLGRAGTPAERHAYRLGLQQQHVLLPPFLRALVAVPGSRDVLTRAMLASWLLADERYRGQLRVNLESVEPAGFGNRLQVWTRRPISFLHLEKTAGTSLLAVISDQFHPGQIDPDPWRASPPHIVSAFAIRDTRIRFHPLVWGHYDLPALRRLDPSRFVFTMLREPRARILSLYYFWRSLQPSQLGANHDNPQVRVAHRLGLLEFLCCRDPMVVDFIDNFYVRRLTGLYVSGCADDPLEAGEQALRQALAALHSIDFVGITEQTELSIERLGRLLDIEGLKATPRLNAGRDLADAPDFRPVEREPITPKIEAALDRLTVLDRTVYAAALRHFDEDRPRNRMPSADVLLVQGDRP